MVVVVKGNTEIVIKTYFVLYDLIVSYSAYLVQSLGQVIGRAVLVALRIEDELSGHGVRHRRRHLQQLLVTTRGTTFQQINLEP